MDRPGVKDFAIEAIRKLQGIDVTNDEQLIDIISADGNRDDARRFEEGAFFRIPVHVDQQRKRSGARGYIAETLAARNEDGTKKYPLTLSLNSLAQRILTKKNSTGKPRAHGVEYLRGEGLYSADLRYDGTEQGDVLVVKASREVIVAGGAFNTPQILKLSGIGPRHELERFDIPVVVDLPAVVRNHTRPLIDRGASKDIIY